MAKQDLTVELFYSGTWHTVEAYTRDPALINRDRKSGAEPTPSSVSLTLKGIYNPKNPMSPLWGVAGQNTPIRLKLSTDVRFYGEVAAWKPLRAIKGDLRTVIDVTGILRRIGQGADPLRSALTRFIGGSSPLAWWPLESGDGRETTSSPSGIAGGTPMAAQVAGGITSHRLSGVVGASTTGPPGAAAAVDLSAGGQLSGLIPASSPTAAFRYEIGALIKETIPVADTVVVFQIVFGTSLVSVIATEEAGEETFILFEGADAFDSDQATTVLDDAVWHHYRLDLSTPDAGASTDYELAIDGVVVLSGNAAGLDYSYPTETVVSPGGEVAAASHPVVWSGTLPADSAGYEAFTGHTGEQAHDRFERLCDEEGIPVTIEGTQSQPMGPQPIDTLAAQFAEIERTDDGVMFEPRDSYGLLYRTGRERYNRPVVLALDYAAQEVAPPLVPVLDDLAIRNDVTVALRTGVTAQAVLESGPLSVLAPPDGVGRYKTQVDVNTSTVEVLPGHASWHLHKGTVDGIRYATVTVDLDAVPSLAADAAAVDIGDIITIDNLPDDETLVQARMMVTGYVERIESHHRVITYSCIPASTFDVGVYGTAAIVSRYDSADSTLAAGYDDNDTSFSVATAAGHALWVTGSSGPTFPFDIGVAGIRIRVTAISGSSSPQTFTVQRSMDGYDKALSSGAQVRLWNPARYGL